MKATAAPSVESAAAAAEDARQTRPPTSTLDTPAQLCFICFYFILIYGDNLTVVLLREPKRAAAAAAYRQTTNCRGPLSKAPSKTPNPQPVVLKVHLEGCWPSTQTLPLTQRHGDLFKSQGGSVAGSTSSRLPPHDSRQSTGWPVVALWSNNLPAHTLGVATRPQQSKWQQDKLNCIASLVHKANSRCFTNH